MVKLLQAKMMEKTTPEKVCFPRGFPWRASVEGFPGSFLGKSADHYFSKICVRRSRQATVSKVTLLLVPI